MVALMPVQYFLILDSGATIIRYVGWVVFAAWIAQKLLYKEPLNSVVAGPLVKPILAFLYLCLISALWSFSTTWNVAFFSYLQLVLWVFMIIDLIDSQPRLERLLFSLLIGILASAYILLQEFLTRQAGWEFGTVAEGGFGDRNTTAASFLYGIPFLFYWILEGSLWRKTLGIASVGLLLVGVGISASRTNLLILPLLLVLLARSMPNLSHKAHYVLIACLLLTISMYFWPWAQIEYRFSDIWAGGTPEDLGGRIKTFDRAFEQFFRSPLLGRGLGSYRARYNIPAHNLFLEMAMQLGVFGLLAMVWIWVVAWRRLAAAHQRAQASNTSDLFLLIRAVRLSLTVYLLYSLSMSSQSERLLWFTFALSGVCYNLAHKKTLSPTSNISTWNRNSSKKKPYSPT